MLRLWIGGVTGKKSILTVLTRRKKYTVQKNSLRETTISTFAVILTRKKKYLPPKELIQQYQEKRASLNADIDRILGSESRRYWVSALRRENNDRATAEKLNIADGCSGQACSARTRMMSRLLFLLGDASEQKRKQLDQSRQNQEGERTLPYIFRGADNLPYEKVGKNEPVCIADEVPFEIPEHLGMGAIWQVLAKLFYRVKLHQDPGRCIVEESCSQLGFYCRYGCGWPISSKKEKMDCSDMVYAANVMSLSEQW